MAFYSQNVDELFKSIQYQPNILERYDGVTYNIRFYMLPYEYAKEVSNLRKDGQKVKVTDDRKIVIAQTGVSSQYNIESVTVQTVYTSLNTSNNITATEFTMQLKEINSCSLINKITVVSKLLGYESYVMQPYGLDIWFSGYEHGSGKPVGIIGEVLNYEIILGEVATAVNDTGTTFTFKMSPTTDIAVSKEINMLNSLGICVDKVGTVGSFSKALEDKINEEYFKQFNNPEAIKKMYNDGKFITIDLVDGNPSNGFNDAKTFVQDMNYESTSQNKNMTPFSTKSQTPFPKVKNVAAINHNRWIASFGIDPDTGLKETNSSSEVNVKPQVSDTLNGIFQEICAMCPQLREDTAKPIYNVQSVGNIDGTEHFKINMKVIFETSPMIGWFIKHSNTQQRTFETMKQSIEEMQREVLLGMMANKTLQKRYDYMFSGVDTSVIELETSLDKLWYMNSGKGDIKNIITSNNDNIKTEKLSTQQTTMNQSTSNETYDERLKKAIDKSYQGIEGIRTNQTDGMMYLDDLYRSISNTDKIKALSFRHVLEKEDKLSADQIKTNDNTNREYQLSKVAFSNFFETGNLVEIDLKILGDPYWLWLRTNNTLFEIMSNEVRPSQFYHFAFKMNTGMDINEKGMYDIETVADITTIYQLVSCISTFEGGKFTQKLHGAMQQAFMHTPNLKV